MQCIVLLPSLPPSFAHPLPLLGQLEGEDMALHTLHVSPQDSLSILTCHGMGKLALWDPRQEGGPAKIISEPQPPPGRETPEQYAVAVCGGRCASLSSRGALQLHDLRASSEPPLACCRLPSAAAESLPSRFTHHTAAGSVCVQVCIGGTELSMLVSEG